MMLEEILEFAKAIGEVEAEEEGVLSKICHVVQEQLIAQLKDDITIEDCRGAFVIAAAWLALADLCISRQASDIMAWSVGEVNVKSKLDGQTQAEVYRKQAQRLMAPYCKDEQFVFVGVTG